MSVGKRRAPLRSSGLPERRTRVKPRNAKRKASEMERAYGPPERREFVKAMPCAACRVVGYSENAHLLGNGGMSRKADADTVGPLCGPRAVFAVLNYKIYPGCHNLYDKHRATFDAVFPTFDPERTAAETQAAWSAHLHQQTGAGTT